MKILVTGSNGCVGRELESICKDDSSLIFLKRGDCDLLDRESTIKIWKTIQPDYVVHLAAYVPGFYNIDRVDSFSKNVRINENVLEASHLTGVEKGIFCLSVNMFPDKPSRFPMDESMIFEGELAGAFAGYGYSKRMMALQCQNYNLQYNRKYIGLISSNIYGPHDNFKSGRLIPNLISKFKEAKKNRTDMIINGTGEPLRQFIYSLDLAKIIKYLAKNYSGTDNIICCSDEEISISLLADMIGSIIGFDHEIKFDSSKPDGVAKKTMTNKHLKKIIPEFAFTSLKEGLTETIKESL